jgi:hypothetical protein
MNFEKLLTIDRRIIFIAMAVAIIIPLIVGMKLPVGEQKMTRSLFDVVDSIDIKKKALMVSTDYAPQTEAENQPMTIALIRHGLARHCRVIVISFYAESIGLAKAAVDQVINEFNSRPGVAPADSVVYGRDVVLLSWVPPPIVPILSMGQSITGVYKTEFDGADTRTLPIMQGIRSYDDIGIVVAVSGASSPQWFVQFAQPRYGVKVGAAVTAVSAPDLYPYYTSGQFSGMLGGMKGAAEYENLIQQKYRVGGRQRAMEGMGAQSVGHLVIMAFVVIGNIGYFVARRRQA